MRLSDFYPAASFITFLLFGIKGTTVSCDSPGGSQSKEIEGHPELVTLKGTLRGNQITVNGKRVWEFLGIPFAKPPLKELRFKKPTPWGQFEDTYDATKLPNSCFQGKVDSFGGFLGETVWQPPGNVSEDCLYLNVWVPQELVDNKEKELSAVLFWIYGGAFFCGSSTLDVYNGAHLASQESTVVVSSQYRLGPLGFLYFGNQDAPGNMGFWDQNLALQWVHENIASFGGDNNRITLFGQSAGAASVGYHLLSPVSRGYFKRAVMMSGTPGAKYSIVEPSILKQRSVELAKLSGCDVQKSEEEVIVCLQELEASVLDKLQWSFYKNMLHFPFVPTIDGDFIPDEPTEMLKRGDAKKSELMISTVQNEGTYLVIYEFMKFVQHNEPASITHDRFLEILRQIFGSATGFSSLEQNAIINHYTNWMNPDDGAQNLQRISDAVADYFFLCPIKQFADMWSGRGLNTFFFHLTQRTKNSPWADWTGAMHGDEIQYVLGNPMYGFTPEEKSLSSLMMKLVANFAKTGTPSESWEKYSRESPVYVDFNATAPSGHSSPNVFGPRAEHCAFWNDFMPQITSTKIGRRSVSSLSHDGDNNWSWNQGRGVHFHEHGIKGGYIVDSQSDECE